MPLKAGHNHETIRKNVHEMVKAGHPLKQAIAASLAKAHAPKNMAMGGEVEEDDVHDLGSLNEMGEAHPSEVANPENLKEHMNMADALDEYMQKHDQVEMDDAKEGKTPYAEGGIVESMEEKPILLAQETPKMNMDNGEVISEAIKKAIEDRKNKRRF